MIKGNVETECDQAETWKLSVIRGNVETECDQGKRGIIWLGGSPNRVITGLFNNRCKTKVLKVHSYKK